LKIDSRFERGGIFLYLDMLKNKHWTFGFLIILISGVICCLLAISNPHTGELILGSLAGILRSIISTISGMIIFLLVALALKKQNWQVVALIISILNVIHGISLYFRV